MKERERERRQSCVPSVVLRGAIGSKHRVGDGVNPTVFPLPTTIYNSSYIKLVSLILVFSHTN